LSIRLPVHTSLVFFPRSFTHYFFSFLCPPTSFSLLPPGRPHPNHCVIFPSFFPTPSYLCYSSSVSTNQKMSYLISFFFFPALLPFQEDRLASYPAFDLVFGARSGLFTMSPSTHLFFFVCKPRILKACEKIRIPILPLRFLPLPLCLVLVCRCFP